MFNLRASRRKGHRAPEGVTTREALQDFGSGRAEAAVPRNVFRKGRCRECAVLVGNPEFAVHSYSPIEGPTPRVNLLAVEKEANRGGGTYRVKRSLGVPSHNAGIEDGVGQGKEHLHIIIEVVFIAGGDKLCKEVPVAWRQLRCGPSAQYSAIIFCSSVRLALIVIRS